MLSSTAVYAQEPNILGTYSGPVTSTEFGCGTPNPGDPPNLGPFTENATLTITISNQTGASFSGSGTETFPDGDVDSITFSGTVDTAGNVSGSFSTSFIEAGVSSGTGSGTFSGTISSGSFNFSASGQDDTNTGATLLCFLEESGTLTLISGGSGDPSEVNPEVEPSSTITEAVLFNTQIQTQVSDISRHISGALSGRRFFGGPRVGDNKFKLEGGTGLNAGDGSTIPYGVWGSYSYTDFDNDLSSTAFDGNSHSFLGGVDVSLWDNTVLGVAFGYDNGDIDTTFNGGNQDIDSYTVHY